MRTIFLVFLPATALVLAIFVCVVCRMKRVKSLLFPGIPDPKRVFNDLFDDYNGNFQEWIGASKDLNVDCQSNCIPVECQIEEEAVRVKTECEDSPADMSGSKEPAPQSMNENSESSREDASTCTNQLLVHHTDTINMSAIVMDANMYIRL
ncbi:cytokine receptor-like factor 2 [Leucoraja erinacea]|uniref:cytokine receptor-like factor 2 n=1 Tax=Leucoraja erinaceus TaxID=7782 RepID=UPI002458BA69|nr:cytokine receptor-like factor 2 [Leucoraja erinacea]